MTINITKVGSYIQQLRKSKNLTQNQLIYAGDVEGINSKMNIDLEDCLSDPYKKEALITEIIVQDLMNGGYVDISDATNYLEYDHWKNMVKTYAHKHGIK